MRRNARPEIKPLDRNIFYKPSKTQFNSDVFAYGLVVVMLLYLLGHLIYFFWRI